MGKFFVVCCLLGIPPWGIFLSPFGVGVQIVAVAFQLVGLVGLIANLVCLLRHGHGIGEDQ